MKKIVLPSLILVIISMIPIFFKDEITWEEPAYMRISTMILCFLSVFLIIRRYKQLYAIGPLAFGKAFGYGFKVVLCYSIIASVFYYIYVKMNEESYFKFVNTVFDKIHQNSLEQQGSTSASMDKHMNSIFTIIMNPIMVSVFMFIGHLFYGTFYTLISAAILKSKKENVDEEVVTNP